MIEDLKGGVTRFHVLNLADSMEILINIFMGQLIKAEIWRRQ